MPNFLFVKSQFDFQAFVKSCLFHLLITSLLLYFFSGDNDRDVFNEKPSKEELVSATQVRDCNLML